MSRSCGMHSSLRRADGQRNAQSSLSALKGQCGVHHSATVLDIHWKRHLDRHCSLLVLQLIQTVSHRPPGQKWKQFSYQVGSLFDSIVSPWVTFGGLEMQFSGLQTDDMLAPKLHYDPPAKKSIYPCGSILGSRTPAQK